MPTTIDDPMQTNSLTTGSNPMMRYSNTPREKLLKMLGGLAMAVFVATHATAATPRIDESQLLKVGFKVLVATTKVQQDWVRSLPPGEIRPMQRTGKKFFIYPDASRNQIYVGGPKEFEAYAQLHPESRTDPQAAASKGSAYRAKQDNVMREATARDLSDPFLGASWADLGW